VFTNELAYRKIIPMKYTIDILMGSQSDLVIMTPAIDIIQSFGVTCTVNVLSAHRTPHETIAFVEQSTSDVFIAGAGGAAHLPGVIAGITTKPVIGVPINAAISISGIDSLLSIVQMPPGVPVATVGINGAKNAGILAIQILGVADPNIQKQLIQFKADQRQAVLAANEAIQNQAIHTASKP
jgi:5-(carboxyamino)imidazole ribonucleotide mutase